MEFNDVKFKAYIFFEALLRMKKKIAINLDRKTDNLHELKWEIFEL